MKPLALEGATFGDLTVLERVPSDRPETLWRCRCVCGAETFARGSEIKTRRKQSCGCLRSRIGRIPHGTRTLVTEALKAADDALRGEDPARELAARVLVRRALAALRAAS
jgi:hypothetical protein